MKKLFILLATTTLALSTYAFATEASMDAMQQSSDKNEMVIADSSTSKTITTETDKKVVKHHNRHHPKHKHSCNCHHKDGKHHTKKHHTMKHDHNDHHNM